MNEQIKDTKDFLQNISDILHRSIAENFPDSWVLVFQIFAKFILLVLVIYLLDFVVKIIINLFFRFFVDGEKYPVLKSIYKSRITNSFGHLIALSFGSYALYSVFYRHPKSFEFLERSIHFAIVIVIGGMMFRTLKAIEYFYQLKKDYYRIVALKAILQTVRTLGIFIISVVAICVIFGISGTTILGSLGAMTAIIVLVFRDTILGFVTGIHVAASKNLKVGDWIGIPKYNLEGTIQDINVLTTKIQNFDKTISTIPTYDLLSTEVKNIQKMSESNTRRIKKSIIFNIKSFRFLDDELIAKLQEINLIKDYLAKKQIEISNSKTGIQNQEKLINGQQLTNIGTFRKYVYEYLLHNKNIDSGETILVRQMEITSQGLPLEIYCFTNDSKWENFEQIQSDIFDHLLVASKEFDLEIMQISIKI